MSQWRIADNGTGDYREIIAVIGGEEVVIATVKASHAHMVVAVPEMLAVVRAGAAQGDPDACRVRDAVDGVTLARGFV